MSPNQEQALIIRCLTERGFLPTMVTKPVHPKEFKEKDCRLIYEMLYKLQLDKPDDSIQSLLLREPIIQHGIVIFLLNLLKNTSSLFKRREEPEVEYSDICTNKDIHP